MIKILIVMTSGLKRDGITSSQLEILKHMNLDKLKIDIASVTLPEKDVVDEFESIGCHVIQFPDRLKIIPYTVALNQRLKNEKYNVVHIHGSSSLMAIELVIAKINRVTMRIAHSRNTTCKYFKIDKLLRPVFYHSYNRALACGVDAGNWMFQDREYTVLHNGKDLSRFSFDENARKKMRDKLNLKNEIAVGFVGSLTYQKNISFMMEIFEKYHSLNIKSKLYVMGDGPERTLVEQFITNKFDDAAILTGRIDNVDQMLQAMDIMILPSRYEGLPNVVLEWQISGLPCFISDKITKECAVTDLVEFLSIDMGADLWAEKMNQIKSNDVVHRRLTSLEAVNAMKREGFDIKKTADYLRHLYLEALKE